MTQAIREEAYWLPLCPRLVAAVRWIWDFFEHSLLYELIKNPV